MLKVMFRSIFIMLIALSMPVAVFAANSSGIEFQDTKDHWAKNYIEYLVKKQIVSGKTDSTFEPNQTLTRAEFTTLLVKAMNEAATTSVTKQTYYNDVHTTDWYYLNIAEASNYGIISGYEDGSFQPERAVTRRELAAILVRALEFKSVSLSIGELTQKGVLGQYKDLKELSWGQKEIAEIINAKVMNGLSEDEFGPDKATTRAEASVVIVRFLSLLQ